MVTRRGLQEKMDASAAQGHAQMCHAHERSAAAERSAKTRASAQAMHGNLQSDNGKSYSAMAVCAGDGAFRQRRKDGPAAAEVRDDVRGRSTAKGFRTSGRGLRATVG